MVDLDIVGAASVLAGVYSSPVKSEVAMWDPKRLEEERTPESSAAAPRTRGAVAERGMADSESTCVDCQQSIRKGDAVMVVRTVFAESLSTQLWHPQCWSRAYPENLAHYFHNFTQ